MFQYSNDDCRSLRHFEDNTSPHQWWAIFRTGLMCPHARWWRLLYGQLVLLVPRQTSCYVTRHALAMWLSAPKLYVSITIISMLALANFSIARQKGFSSSSLKHFSFETVRKHREIVKLLTSVSQCFTHSDNYFANCFL